MYVLNKNKKYYVYMYTSPSGKHYVGRSCNPKERRSCNDGSGYKYCLAFWRAIQKYGWENFQYQVLEEGINYDKIAEREQYWIDYYHSSTDENGYNLLKPINSNMTYTDETRERLSASHMGQTPWNKGKTNVYSEETLKRMSDAKKGKRTGKDNPNYGKHMPEETRKKISQTLKGKFVGEKNPNYGRHLSEEAKKKISESLKGKFVGEKSPMYGKPLSDETKQKLSKALKGKFAGEKNPMYGVHLTVSEETRKKISEASSRPVAQFDLEGNYIQTFKSRKEAADATGTLSELISACCCGRKKSANGFQWCNIEDMDKVKKYESYRTEPIPIVQIKDDQIINYFSSIKEAADSIGKKSPLIQKCVAGGAKTAYGYIWKRASEINPSELKQFMLIHDDIKVVN